MKLARNRCIIDNFGCLNACVRCIFVRVPTIYGKLLSNLHPDKQFWQKYIHCISASCRNGNVPYSHHIWVYFPQIMNEKRKLDLIIKFYFYYQRKDVYNTMRWITILNQEVPQILRILPQSGEQCIWTLERQAAAMGTQTPGVHWVPNLTHRTRPFFR